MKEVTFIIKSNFIELSKIPPIVMNDIEYLEDGKN